MRCSRLGVWLVVAIVAIGAQESRAQEAGEIVSDLPGRTVPVQRLFGEFPFKSPEQIHRVGERWYVLDEKTHRIVVFGPDGRMEGQIGELGSGPGELYEPSDFDVVGDRIYVLDSGNRRVQVLGLEGEPISAFPELPKSKGFAVTSKGEVLLGQPRNGSLISVYDAEGELLRRFGETKSMTDLWGPERGEDTERYGIAASRVHIDVDEDDAIWVSYLIGPLLEKYSPDGRLLVSHRMEGPEIDRLETIFWDLPSGTHVLSTPLDGVGVDLVTKSVAVGRSRGGKAILVLLGDDSIYWADEKGMRVARLEPDRGDDSGWLWRIQADGQGRLLLLASVFTSGIYELDLATAAAQEER